MNREPFCRAKLRARALGAARWRHRYSPFRNAVVTSVACGHQAWHSATVRLVRSLVVIGWIGLIPTAAQAHPHVWATMRTELVYAPDASVTAVQHAWTFDDMFSAFATQGVHAHTKGQFTRAELQPLAQVNVDSLKEYAYFTYAKINGRPQKDAFGAPTNYWLDYDPKATVLTLHFTLPFKRPVKAKRLTVEIYDPEFFIDFGFADTDPVRLVDAPPQCRFTDEKPTDGFFSSTLKFDKSFMTSEANVGMGMNFANRITVTCP
jgi:ABC-type uncharacterized transport system substrate-binding protein